MYQNHKQQIDIFLILFVMFLFSGSVFAQTTDDGLVGYWGFDDSTAKDGSSFGHYGTLIGNAAIVNDTEKGKVLWLDGDGDYVDLGNGDWTNPGNNITVTAFIKVDVFDASYQTIIAKGNQTYRLARQDLTDWLDAHMNYTSSSYKAVYGNEFAVNDGQWHHAAMTYDGSIMKLYVDGELEGTNTLSTLNTSTANLCIGRNVDKPERDWQGWIDDVRLYNRALDANEILEVYFNDFCEDIDTQRAENPNPADSGWNVSLMPALSWQAGSTAPALSGYDLYFGTNYDDVESRAGSVYIGYFDTASYNPGTLAANTTYYWAVDTVNSGYPDSPWLGDVWSFTTMSLDLVGYWNFNDGTAKDSSGFGRDGALYGNAMIVDDPARGKVLQLDGSGDYMQINGYKGVAGSASRSICSWIKTTDTSANPTLISWGSNNDGQKWQSYIISNKLRLAVGTGHVTGSRVINDGKWHHVAMILEDDGNANANEIRLYVDGAGEAISASTAYAINTGSSYDVKVGAWMNGYYLNGLIDDVRIYEKALTEEQVRQLAGIQKATEPCPAYRKVDVDTYTTLSWKSAPRATGRNLYLGTDENLVAARNASVYIGAMDTNSFQTDMLTLATTYYWAVDEVNDAEVTSPWKGDVWQFLTRNSTEGVYADLFIDAGPGVSAYTDKDIGAVNLLGYKSEFINAGDSVAGRAIAANIYGKTNYGDWKDDNGVLLYPDREPRFRLYYCNGGGAGGHFKALNTANGENGLPPGTCNRNVEDFYWNGGSYTGSCAGAFMTMTGYWGQNAGAGTSIASMGLSSRDHDAFIPDGKTVYSPFWENDTVPLPISPFVREGYYPELFNTENIYLHAYYHNGGCTVKPQSTYKRSEVLLTYDLRWIQKTIAGWPVEDFSDRPAHRMPMIWACKQSDYSGREVPCGSHPERRQIYGIEVRTQAAIYRYASTGFGRAQAKAALTSGVTRQMNNNAAAGYEKVGDKQYHHFTIEVPAGTPKLKIDLDGSMYDLNLYAKRGDFAFAGEPGTIAATNGTGSDETLIINNPQPGTWFIGVKCNTTVSRTRLTNYWKYTGNFEVLNGIAYDITATFEPAKGDIDFDGKVNGKDLKYIVDNWLVDNGHIRQPGELIGLWDFAEGSGTIATDVSGNDNTATLYGDAQWLGGAIKLDGSGDYLQTADSGEKLQLTDSYSISVKLNAAATQMEGAGIISKCGPDAGIPASHWSLSFGFNFNATTDKIIMINGMTIWDTGIALSQIAGSWHTVTVAYGANLISSYLDGQLISSAAFSTLPLNGAGHLNIGCDRQKFRYYNGQIDDIYIFDYELTPSEVQQLHQYGFFFEENQQLVGRWTFDDGSAKDISGNGHNGTLTNVAAVYDPARGMVMNFQGSGYISMPSNVFSSIDKEITISLWQFGSDAQPINNNIFEVRNSNGKRLINSHMPYNGKIFWEAGSDGTNYDTISKAALTSEYKGQWNNWAFTKNTASGEMKMYLNGQLWHSDTGKTKSMADATVFNIGCNGNLANFYYGMIDDFRIYNYVLNAENIADIYNGTEPVVKEIICIQRPDGDLNGDCKVDYMDFAELAGNWLR